MRRRSLLALALGLPLAAAGEPARDPFTVPAAQVTQRVRAVAICPPRNDTRFEIPTPVTGRHAAALQRELERAGVRSTPLGFCARAWIEASALLGGVYDPVTGDADPEKWKLAREHTLRELAREHAIDGIVDWGYFEAPIYDLQSSPPWWSAAGEPLTLGGQRLEVYEAGIGANRVLGLWAWLSVSDRSDATLYRSSEPLAWSELRLGARTQKRELAALTAPERDARVGALLRHFVRAFRNAHTPAAREAAAAFAPQP